MCDLLSCPGVPDIFPTVFGMWLFFTCVVQLPVCIQDHFNRLLMTPMICVIWYIDWFIWLVDWYFVHLWRKTSLQLKHQLLNLHVLQLSPYIMCAELLWTFSASAVYIIFVDWNWKSYVSWEYVQTQACRSITTLACCFNVSPSFTLRNETRGMALTAGEEQHKEVWMGEKGEKI